MIVLVGDMKDLIERIVVDPKVMVGKPVIRGTRITVDCILEALAAGMTFKEVAKDYGLTTEDVKAALIYARKVLGGEEVIPLEA
jgi:uncharacterized protein (DUF433 family)